MQYFDYKKLKYGDYFYSRFSEFKKCKKSKRAKISSFSGNKFYMHYDCICTFTIGTSYKVGERYFKPEDKILKGRHPKNRKLTPDII